MRDTAATTAETKLTRTEFAVIRAYAQGMSPVDIAHRYLSDPDDEDHLTEAEAIRKIMALRDRLIQFALQHSRPDIAQMFEALRARSDVGMTRRVDALTSLEGLGQTRPQPEHEVGLWFRPSLGRRLTAAGIRRISDLVALANTRGSSWWRWAPGIGPASAEVVTRWLLARQAPGMVAQGAAVNPYVRPPSEAGKVIPGPSLTLSASMPHPVPLERMLPPAGHPLAADLQSVRRWLYERPRQPNTLASYRREAERLLLWLARERLTLDALTDAQLARYGRFLAAPEPYDFWCGPAAMRAHLHWRPFEGPLSPASAEASLRVIAALLRARDREAGQTIARRAMRGATSRLDARFPPRTEGRDDARNTASAAQVDAFVAWLFEARETSARLRAALLAACLLRHEKFRLQHIPQARCADLTYRIDALAWHAGTGDRGGCALHPLTAVAVRLHWEDRSEAGMRPAGNAALLAPLTLPDTARARTKRLERPDAGYSPAGLEKLLRWSWTRFAASAGLGNLRFTPKQLQNAIKTRLDPNAG
ncbi:putative integrase protein [Cupriavidus gilardii J11]|uniref:Putative integrase protein n=1 Tax=Cupriavidus gilardii J11 TaxID=936133 RepID=A0A562BRV2_9BURK|nr:phage integrase family protein [Cupriavidus gilardii]TWG87493.1 putative integrase protein [Cupriavidus gilardii J11]